MLRRPAILALTLAAVSACSPPGGLLVSDEANPIGGNLFIEPTSDGLGLLALDGPVTNSTARAFYLLLEDVDVDRLVITQSPGGDLFAAHLIGREIRARGIDTVVLVNCISACVDIFIAGEDREMTDFAELGLHAATDREFSYFVDRRYWSDMGFSLVNETAYTVPDDKIWIIPPERALRLRLATNIVTSES